MKKKTIKFLSPEFIAVLVVALSTALLSIIHVILGLARTPDDYIYMATGHYYLDYFVYLQAIAQGLAGKLLPHNLLASDDPAISFRFIPYALLGNFGKLFRLSPMFIYWFFTFLFTVIFIYVIYLAIRKIMVNERIEFKITALLIAVFASPFFSFKNMTLYDFWYGPSNFIRRFGTVPYHLISFIIGLFILIYFGDLVDKIKSLSLRKILLSLAAIISILLILLIFSPFIVVTLILTISFAFVFYFLKTKNKKYIFYLFGLFIGFAPIALIIQKIYNASSLINTIKGIESQWQIKPSLTYLLFNLGPMIIFFPLGIVAFFKKINPTRLIIFMFVLLSYGLFLSPLSNYLKTHNLRFLSSINYALFGVLTYLGIRQACLFSGNYKKYIFAFILSGFFIYAFIFNGYVLLRRIKDIDPYTPITRITYIPKNLIKGFNFLKKQKKDIVLTTPYSDVGLLVPVLAVKKVYVGRENETPDFVNKQARADSFFEGQSEEEARAFIYKNKINYVIKTATDPYFSSILDNYGFLKLIFTNPTIQIWEVGDEKT